MGRQTLIERMHLKSLLGFESVTIDFGPALVVLSGPSGAGKSVFISALLSAFGIENPEANLCEITLHRPKMMNSESYELESELIIRYIKKERVRYLINDQNISRVSLKKLFASFINYLSVRDRGGFENFKLINILDDVTSGRDPKYRKNLKEYRKRFAIYKEKQLELKEIEQREKKFNELMEFTKFEIEKIDTIDPKPGEDEDLLNIKKQLSKIDKLNDALNQAKEIFVAEASVSEVFLLAGEDGGYFFDAMNQLRADFEGMQNLAQELEDTDVEALLDRLEKISDLKNRYGSIEDAIAYRIAKEEELRGYERMEENKAVLEQFLQMERVELETIARKISVARILAADELAESMQEYLHRLKLPEVGFVFKSVDLGEHGVDMVELMVQDRSVDTLSGGEHNRLRLTLMVAALEIGENLSEGIIVLDEIDANVSGDESIAIAEIISKLSKRYQVFAISHQPHLASKADQHILIGKNNGQSFAKTLDMGGRVSEVARIIEGESAGDEAIAFAKNLLKNSYKL